MAEPVPYGLPEDMLAEATPAARAAAARLAHIACNPSPWERIDFPTLFLNMVVLAAQPRAEWVWKLYHRICRPLFEGPLFAGMDEIERDPVLPDDQREAVQQVRAFRAWLLSEDSRRKGRVQTEPRQLPRG